MVTEEKSADPGTEFDQPAKPMHFGGALALSLVLFNSGFVVSQALRWTNHFLGLLNGLFQTIFFSFGWCMFFLPWSLGVLYCFGKKVDKGRLTWKGYGESKPLKPNTSEEDRAVNRRVEFRVVER